ncbi:MAG: hypothetical protein ACE5KA_04005 [Nitrososphaerales archaeon]
MSANKYEITKGIRNGAIGGLVAGLVLALPMLATNSLNLEVLIPTTVLIGAIYGIVTSNHSLRPSSTRDAIALGIMTGIVSFAVLVKPVSTPLTELVVPLLQYAIFGAVLGWMTSFLARKQEQHKIGVEA